MRHNFSKQIDLLKIEVLKSLSDLTYRNLTCGND